MTFCATTRKLKPDRTVHSTISLPVSSYLSLINVWQQMWDNNVSGQQVDVMNTLSRVMKDEKNGNKVTIFRNRLQKKKLLCTIEAEHDGKCEIVGS